MKRIAHTLICLTAICLAASAQQYDVIIRNGTVYDGSGGTPIIADVALQGDRIARIGRLGVAQAKTEINAKGLAVAPGFHQHDDRRRNPNGRWPLAKRYSPRGHARNLRQSGSL